jgi:hypothetical protein
LGAVLKENLPNSSSQTRRIVMSRLTRSAFVCGLVGGVAVMAAAQEMPPLPKPGPEHALFKDVAGTWDARVETFMSPGEPSVSTGVETNRVGCGGLCLISDFKGEMMGTTFEGHGTEVWDATKKKYVGTWTDSMTLGLSLAESSYDPATKTMTGWMEGPDMSGNVSRMKSTSTQKDADTRIFEMHNVGADGSETLGMRITYTRKK